MKRCNAAGCRELINVTDTYCDMHQGDSNRQYNKARYQNDREYVSFYSLKPWRDTRYQRLLIDEFLCVRCRDDIGIFTNAVMVHHMFNRKDYPEHELDIQTLVSLCNSCHEFVESSRDSKYVWTK